MTSKSVFDHLPAHSNMEVVRQDDGGLFIVVTTDAPNEQGIITKSISNFTVDSAEMYANALLACVQRARPKRSSWWHHMLYEKLVAALFVLIVLGGAGAYFALHLSLLLAEVVEQPLTTEDCP